MKSSWQHESKRRAIIIIIDGLGAGASPDAADFGDSANCNTLGNVASRTPGFALPNLARLGLGNITAIVGVPAQKEGEAIGLYGKLQELSKGKDTQSGHWELMGLTTDTPFPTYPQGFPQPLIEQFINKTGCGGILGNKPASGTDILTELGEEHQKTGLPIVYTSGDSVFQIACHTDIVPLEKLYDWCLIARQMLQPPNQVGRVIARPFSGKPGSYKRLQGDRRDYVVPPGSPTLLDHLVDSGIGVLGIGKIVDIFAGRGISHAKHTANNEEGLNLTLDALKRRLDLKPLQFGKGKLPEAVQIIFTNLVDTDSLFGHRRDVSGYGRALAKIDNWLGTMLPSLSPDDLMIISSDHGNDPTAEGTDHTREYVPLLIFSPALSTGKLGSDTGLSDLGVRTGFADVACTIAHWLDFPWTGPGSSCLKQGLSVDNSAGQLA